VCLLN